MRYYLRHILVVLGVAAIFGVLHHGFHFGGRGYGGRGRYEAARLAERAPSAIGAERRGYEGRRTREGGVPAGVDTGATASPSKCAAELAGGEAPELLNPKLGAGAQELCYSGYDVLYSPASKTPIWSAEHLTKDRIEVALKMPRDNTFHQDPTLPADIASTLEDYKGTGFDRGHMSPSGDMPDAQAQYESFSLANMIPQDKNNNEILWEGVESATRDLAVGDGEVYVVTGPIFPQGEVRTVGRDVMVPVQIFKAVYDPSRGAAAAYVTWNKPGMEWHAISINDLTQLTGIDPFPAARDAEARMLELGTPHPHRHTTR